MGVILVADSSASPTPAQAAAAKAAGYSAWLGYRASSANENLLNPWPPSAFAVVRAGGLLTGAFYSGLDDPGWAKADAAALSIPGFLDCESGIRGDGTWTDPWLATSGFGLYGGATVQANHLTHGHPAYILAAYPGVSEAASWPAGVAAPPQPKGWQWADPAVHPVSFASIDTSNYEEAVLAVPPQEDEMYLVAYPGSGWALLTGSLFVVLSNTALGAFQAAGVKNVVVTQADFEAFAAAAATGGLTAAQAGELSAILAKVNADLH